jgi:hypothetical protein
VSPWLKRATEKNWSGGWSKPSGRLPWGNDPVTAERFQKLVKALEEQLRLSE